MKSTLFTSVVLGSMAFSAAAMANDHANHMSDAVQASDQDVSSGVVMVDKVMAEQNGWLVIHRTEDGTTPGEVVGYAPLQAGENAEVQAELQGEVASGEKLMLMVHTEEGGEQEGVFEYTLGSTQDGPAKTADGQLIMTVITAQ
jgi:hypothetical protein